MKQALKIIMLLLFTQNVLNAQVLKRGYSAVTTFYHQIPNAFNTSARIIQIGDPLGAAAATIGTASASNIGWVNPSSLIQPFAWDSLYDIFGVDIDVQGNVFFTSTSYYSYLNPIPSINTLVYKADKANLNLISKIVVRDDVSGGAIGTNKVKNNGYGLGNVTSHKTLNLIYFSNLDDGIIYCVNNTTGNIVDKFDPLLVDASSGSIAPQGERVHGLDINYESDGSIRLYYAVEITNSLSDIRSVKLTATGMFIPTSDALEINSLSLGSGIATYITDLRFNQKGNLAFASRGQDSHNAPAYEYFGQHAAWSIAKFLPVSNYSPGGSITEKNSNGGITFSSVISNNKLVCDSLVWITENALNGVTIYGGHSLPSSSIGPALSPLAANNFTYSNKDNIGYFGKGSFGDIEFFDSCTASKALDLCDQLSVTAIKGQNCCFEVGIKNNFNKDLITSVVFEIDNMNISTTGASPIPGWGLSTPSLHKVILQGATLSGAPLNLPLGIIDCGQMCFTGAGPGWVKVKWKGNAPQFADICVDSFYVDCSPPVEASCVVLNQITSSCDSFGNPKMNFTVKNNSASIIRGLTFYNTNPNVNVTTTLNSATQPFLPILDLAPGATSSIISLPLNVINKDTSGCFFISACDLNVPPGSISATGQALFPKFCCLDSIAYCVSIPFCDNCKAVNVKSVQANQNDCCFKMSLVNNYSAENIKDVLFTAIGGVQFNLTQSSGWGIIPSVSSTFRHIGSLIPGGVGVGTYTDFVEFCLAGTATPPYKVLAQYVTVSGDTLCADTLTFGQCELKGGNCAHIINDSLYCKDNKTYYSFDVQNNSPYAIGQIDISINDITKFKLNRDTVHFSPLLPIGSSTGRIELEIDTINGGAPNFCIYLNGHNAAYTSTSVATICCTDSAIICLPFLNCKKGGCCEFEEMLIPNGITPNGDGKNDLWVIDKPAKCDSVEIVIMNRWGNKVYENKNYLNTWGGTNQGGTLLPQGTYFAIISLKNGSKKGLYIDVRY